MDQFVVEVLQNKVFNRDAEIAIHPMNKEVSSPAEIDEMFDDISYAKGRAKYMVLP